MTRFGIDANILLRVLLNDHPGQSRQGQDLLAGLGDDRVGFLGIPALLEIFWVLRKRYRIPRQAIYEMIRQLLTIKYLEVESSEAVAQALSDYQKRRAEFADVLLAERNAEAGCAFTYTLDRDAAKAIKSMKALGSIS